MLKQEAADSPSFVRVKERNNIKTFFLNAYDVRTLTWHPESGLLSLWTTAGGVAGCFYRRLLKSVDCSL